MDQKAHLVAYFYCRPFFKSSIPLTSTSPSFVHSQASNHQPNQVLQHTATAKMGNWDETKERQFLMCIIHVQSVSAPDWNAVAEMLNGTTGEKFSGNALR